MISKRLVTIGVAMVFFGALRALDAAGVEEALGIALLQPSWRPF